MRHSRRSGGRNKREKAAKTAMLTGAVNIAATAVARMSGGRHHMTHMLSSRRVPGAWLPVRLPRRVRADILAVPAARPSHYLPLVRPRPTGNVAQRRLIHLRLNRPPLHLRRRPARHIAAADRLRVMRERPLARPHTPRRRRSLLVDVQVAAAILIQIDRHRMLLPFIAAASHRPSRLAAAFLRRSYHPVPAQSMCQRVPHTRSGSVVGVRRPSPAPAALQARFQSPGGPCMLVASIPAHVMRASRRYRMLPATPPHKLAMRQAPMAG